MDMLTYLKDITDLAPYVGTPPFCGVRYNPLKLSRERFEQLAPFPLTPCEFYGDGYRVPEDAPSGNHPLHRAGGFYMQEPSAMSAVTALQLQPTDAVLDLCAAPGSKATAIAPHCDYLVANEVNGARAQTLLGNIERMGVSNALITQAASDAIARAFPARFDKVLVDSPCSGEGMFRKHPEILTEWSPELVQMCAVRSKTILRNAAETVKPGGRLVYSTCTYNTEENEKVILDFLQTRPDFEPAETGFSFGETGLMGLSAARRIFIQNGGEGHFVCALKRRDGVPARPARTFKTTADAGFLQDILTAPLAFYKPHPFGILEYSGVKYAVHSRIPAPAGVRVLRAGVKLCSVKGKVVKPEHHLCMAALPSVLQTENAGDVAAFLRGEEIRSDAVGWTAVTYEGLPLGFGKGSGGVLKNHLPHGLRS